MLVHELQRPSRFHVISELLNIWVRQEGEGTYNLGFHLSRAIFEYLMEIRTPRELTFH